MLFVFDLSGEEVSGGETLILRDLKKRQRERERERERKGKGEREKIIK